MARQARFDPGFLSIKHLEVLLFHPGWGASSQLGYPPPPPAFHQAFLIICCYPFALLGPVVGSPISAKPALNFNPSFFIPLFKSLFQVIFSFLFRASNHQIIDKTNGTEFPIKALKSEIRFHTNPGLT